ncbi:class I SAM-dependent methyltransferase [bacterium]|nr:class I SAM-dependent methyltransferase [bacterium]NBX48831.1 class I SAM-dependent methyltransferase [bacterium]
MDLSRVSLIRESTQEQLRDIIYLEQLMCRLGFNDEIMHEQPAIVHRHTGGLRIWQYPNQFAKYLRFLSDKNIQTYLEIGCRWGGTFVLTCEYLKPSQAFAVDIIDSPVSEYEGGTFLKMDSKSPEFREWMSSKIFDLVLIDGDHSYEGVLNDYSLVKDRARIIVFHDIVNDACPGVVQLWNEIKHNYEHYEFTDQYADVKGKYLGIGVLFAA